MPEPPENLPPSPIRISRYLEPIFSSYIAFQMGYLKAMDQAVTAGDLQTLRRLGHTIKGSAGTYELPQAADLGARLEAAALAGNLSLAEESVAALKVFFTGLDVTFVD